MKKGKVFVGLSGGVDSAVSVALLKRTGYDVVGVFIKVWSPDWLPCAWPEERRDAMRVCATLDIPFLTLDLADKYKRDVADYMIEEYRGGRTPNPDVMCNKEIKFGAFYDWAIAQGADYAATGHYAQIKEAKLQLRSQASQSQLLMGVDSNKDQSYFLWNLKQEQLPHILFPVGDKLKSEVRKLAKKFKIPVSDKKDSQGICFLGKLDMKEFLQHYIETKEGNVLDENGKVVGSHIGAIFYTIGEHYIGYVVAKDLEKNTIIVSQKKPDELLNKHEAVLEKINWLDGEPNFSKSYQARVRYRQDLQVCTIDKKRSFLSIRFEKSQILNSGQSVVIYEGETCLGGGVVI